jgi:hypothetical protein
MIIKNDGNKNLMEREKSKVKSTEVSLFPTFSNVSVIESSQRKFGTIQPNDILPEYEFEFTGCLDECQSSTFLVNIIDHR